MHPLLGHRHRLAVYLLAWIPLAALLAYLLHATAAMAVPAAIELAIPLALVYAFACVPVWYICRVFPLAANLGQLLATQVAAAAIAGGLWAALAKLLVLSLNLAADPIPVVWSMGGLLFLLAAAGYYLAIAAERAGEADRRALAARNLAREAELRALKAQINPHFLFNSLNSISALTSTDPGRAREMCVLLGDFLRRTLALGGRDERALIAVGDELALVNAFIAVEQIRFGDRLKFDIHVEDGARHLLLPPLLLQPLVENAVVHGIAPRLQGGCIGFEAWREAGQLRLRITNPVDEDAGARGAAGLGLANVRGRLQALFGAAASLQIVRGPADFTITLSLPEVAP
ncbi:MAG: sensor histidine kinase [Terriglobales bacterium]